MSIEKETRPIGVCPICDSPDRRKLGKTHENMDLEMYRCTGCSAVYADPQPTPETLMGFYRPGLNRWTNIENYREARLPYFEFYCRLVEGLRGGNQ